MSKEKNNPVHPWRKCPLGQHWQRSYYQRPYVRQGSQVKGSHHRATCAKNKSGKDEIYSIELNYIASKYFSALSGPPSSNNLGYPNGNKFDALIRGWTKYWNDVLAPAEPLDPNLVKALIATESSFHPTESTFAGKKAGRARGLMQVTDWSLEILRDENGELKDHLINATQKDMFDPNINIAAGIRWLFRKKETASAKTHGSASWIDTVWDYKGFLDRPDPKAMQHFRDLNKRLQK